MTAAASPWAGLYTPAGKPDLRDTSTSTQSTAGKKARTAFDITAGTSAVTLAINPRQAVYRRGPDFIIASKAANQALTDKHRALRLTRI